MSWRPISLCFGNFKITGEREKTEQKLAKEAKEIVFSLARKDNLMALRGESELVRGTIRARKDHSVDAINELHLMEVDEKANWCIQ
jgi:hypothetical protein